MDFNRKWTKFALDAEVDAYGTSRISAEHNDAVRLSQQRIAELEAEVKRLEIENWYYEVLELVQYDWWLEIIEDVSEVGKEELVNIFKAAAKAAGRSENG